MEFIDLDRLFIPVAKDADAVVDWDPTWGTKYGGWLDWTELLKRRRVALLAEALSGKTKELEYRASVLKKKGLPAFFVRIEDLADRGFAAALHEDDVAAFESWKTAGFGDAWFFLDSVDEARLNGKTFSTALLTFRRELGSANLNRSFVVVSCRVSDWKGKSDRQTLHNELPFEEFVGHAAAEDPDETLLGPIFERERKTTTRAVKEPESKPGDLLVVHLAPLSDQQKMQMATAAGIDGRAFLQAINLSGLDAMTERPGDLIELIGYWSEQKKFGSLLDMTEEGIQRKLREEDVYRSPGVLSPERAREGAERLAAALVLGKTFSLKSPGQELDPTLVQGAIDPSAVLSDWGQADVNALLRTGLFAPGTYGRVKFHHRASQEYLTACWLRRLLDNGCPAVDIHQLLFAEPYGIKTAVPTLLSVTAWLSQWIPNIRNDLIMREPAALIAHGDPKSLSLVCREALLDSYARLDSVGSLDYKHIDYRAAWMFSNPQLAVAVKRAWKINKRSDFRTNLLQFIEEGRIVGCVGLARQEALDVSRDDYSRVLATRGLVACGDSAGLRKLAGRVRAEPDRLSARLAPQLATLLFPEYLSTADLLQLIDRSEQAPQYSSEGFAPHLADLHGRALSRSDQMRLVAGVAGLVLPANSVDVDETSSRHTELCNGIAELACAELDRCPAGEVDAGTLRLLMAIERVYIAHGDQDAINALGSRVRKDKPLHRQLIWADAVTSRTGIPKNDPPTNIFQVGPFTGRGLWRIDMSDIDWLEKDVRSMSHQHERRIAFSAVFVAMQGDNGDKTHQSLLSELASLDPALCADLAEFVTPRKPDQWEASRDAAQLKKQKERQEAKQSWVDFRDELQQDPGVLDRPDALRSWKDSLHRLFYLTKWLKKCVTSDGQEGIAPCSRLSPAFSDEVVEHYRAGMRQAWRHITPERPVYTGENTYTTKYTSKLAIDALNFDSLTPGWAGGLSDAETRIAIRHATMSGTVKAQWAEDLIRSRPVVVLPEIAATVEYEFRFDHRSQDLLLHCAHNDTAARPAVATKVFELLKRKEPADKQTLKYCLQILRRSPDLLPRQKLLRLVHKRLPVPVGGNDEDKAFAYLSVLASADGEGLARFVLAQLVRGSSESEADFNARVQRWLGALFDTHIRGGEALASLQTMTLESLTKLLRLAYQHVRPREDREPGADSTVTSCDLAEGARNALLSELIRRPGADAYEALAGMAKEPEFARYAMRFLELAHRKAQTDSDLVPWTAREVYDFGRLYSAPAKTGMQLLRLALGVLSDIVGSLKNADASSRAVLARAEDEEAVQQWLGERLNERSRNRYHVHREAEVAGRNEPDFVMASTSATAQVAIEVKNANMGWTVKQLEHALTKQLAGDYLLTENRRHGILVVSLHRQKTWRVRSEVWDFERLIAHLQAFATGITSNRTGAVEVKVIGINAHERPEPASKPRSIKVRARSTGGSWGTTRP